MTYRKGLEAGKRSYDTPDNPLEKPSSNVIPWRVTARITIEVTVTAQTPAMARNLAYAKASETIKGTDISVVEIELVGFKKK